MAAPTNQRHEPGFKEKAVGLLILILLIGIVFTFLLTGGLMAGVVQRVSLLERLKGLIGPSEDRLFDASQAGMTPVSPPVEIQIARRLLPAPRQWDDGDGCYAAYAVGPGERISVIRESPGLPGDPKTIERASEEPNPLAKAAAELGTAWLYAYTHSAKGSRLMLQTVDVGRASNAEKLAAARKPAGAEPLTLGRGGWHHESSATYGFWSGRYYTEVSLTGATASGPAAPANVREIAAELAAGQLAYGSETEAVEPSVKETGTKPPAAVVRVADFAPLPGGQAMPPSKIDRFTDNLYEKIDGKEGMFRAFHFVELRFGQYTHAQTQESFDVYIYDMGEPVNAFGIYMGERSPMAQAWSLGRDAYVSGTSAYFCKDKYYVNVLGPPEGGGDKLEVSKAIATAVAATIPGTDKPFWVEQYLPAEGRVPNSLKYEATSGLGYDFVKQMFRIEYEVEGKTFQLFVVRAEDATAAGTLFDKFAEATAKYDKVVSKEADGQGQRLVGESLGVFSVAFTKSVFFGGVTECEDQALAVRQAEAFRAGLPAEAEGGTEPPPKSVSSPTDEEQG